MKTGWEILQEDLFTTYEQMSILDFRFALQFGMWLIILFIPLHGIDRRDYLTSATYCLFLMMCAGILLFAIPQSANELQYLPQHLLIFFVLSCLSVYRWFRPDIKAFRRNKLWFIKNRNSSKFEDQ